MRFARKERKQKKNRERQKTDGSERTMLTRERECIDDKGRCDGIHRNVAVVNCLSRRVINDTITMRDQTWRCWMTMIIALITTKDGKNIEHRDGPSRIDIESSKIGEFEPRWTR